MKSSSTLGSFGLAPPFTGHSLSTLRDVASMLVGSGSIRSSVLITKSLESSTVVRPADGWNCSHEAGVGSIAS